MGAQSRRDLIESLVTSHGEIDFSSLATEFGVSEMTIRRDVDALENKGVLRRVVGGAISLAGKSAEPSFKDRSTAATLAKMRIADATVALLVPNETIIIDSGSTALAVARSIKGRGLGLTVITPSIQVAVELADEEATTVILTGGLVRPGELSLIGFETEQSFARYNCDTFIMGIAGFDAESRRWARARTLGGTRCRRRSSRPTTRPSRWARRRFWNRGTRPSVAQLRPEP